MVDGNVFRVLARVYAIETPIDALQGKKKFEDLANQLLDREDPATHNQAIMELGALICKPATPLCSECPLVNICQSRTNGTQTRYPVKSARKPRRKRFLNFLIILYRGRYVVEKRDGNDIWKGLFQFPLIETPEKISNKDLDEKLKELTPLYLNHAPILEKKHILTHQELHAIFHKIHWPDEQELPKAFMKDETFICSREELKKLPFPQLIKQNLDLLL